MAGFTKLRLKQRKYLDGLSQGMTKRAALAYAGYSVNSSSNSIETPTLKAAFTHIMRRMAPMHRIAGRISEGIDATRVVVIPGPKGEGADHIEVPDFRERREYAKLAAEWTGYVDQNQAITGSGTTIQVLVGNVGDKIDRPAISGTVAAETKAIVATVE